MPEARVRKSKCDVSRASRPRARAGSPRHNYKYISYLLRFVVAGAALYLAFRGENFTEVLEVLLGLNLWIFAGAMGIYIIAQFIFVARWSLLLKVQSIKIGFWPAVRLHLLGLFYNNCLPGAIGGDLPRAWYVTKHTDKKLEAVLSVFVDRVIGLIGMLIMAFGCYWFIPEESREEGFKGIFDFRFPNFDLKIGNRQLAIEDIIIWLGAAFAVVIILVVSNSRGRILLERGFNIVRRHGASILGKVRQSIRIYCHKWPAIVGALLLTFCCQGVTVVAMWLIGREIGINVPAKYYFIFFPVSWLLGAVPISVGGLGIMEGWLKMMFMRVGTISGKNALALALCQRLIFLLVSLPGAVIHLIGAHLPKDFFIDYGKPAE
ncbi:MAG: lysylphosphatidylglycerol synthase transmembrane domain-containing protein [Sedimentisphaerales bacterium]